MFEFGYSELNKQDKSKFYLQKSLVRIKTINKSLLIGNSKKINPRYNKLQYFVAFL